LNGSIDPDAAAVSPLADAVPENHEAPRSDPRSQATSQSGERAEGGKVTSLPLGIDTVIRCKWKDGEYHLARVVHTRLPEGSKDEKSTEYYMHYINMNRRMDSWCTIDMIDLSWHVHDGIDEKRCAMLALNACVQ
jgi:hypothetical protein